MYPQGYICLSEEIHVRLEISGENKFVYYLFQIFIIISEFYSQK